MAAIQTSPRTSRRLRYRWAARLARSSMFSWGVSILAHLLVFAVLYPLVYSEEVQTRRVVIPEARLAPLVEATPDRPPPAVRINRRPEPALAPTPDEHLIAADRFLPSIEADVLPVPLLPTDETAAPAAVGAAVAVSQTGPMSTFFGMAGNAYKIVYVVDLSGSLVLNEKLVLSEIRRSVQALIPTQQFNIVLTYNEQVFEFKPGTLVWANSEHKKQAEAFLSRVVTAGNAREEEAMARAFAARPELIYFLSDGAYHDIDPTNDKAPKTSLETRLDQLDPRHEVKITVIGFEPLPGPRSVLERIARNHGGNFRTMVPQ
ncbi:MAG: hypothetical protein ACUVXJ_05745 [Phycisphaerae bacterium]